MDTYSQTLFKSRNNYLGKSLIFNAMLGQAEQSSMMDMKAGLLSSIRTETAGLFQKELKDALAVEFGVIGLELQALKMEIASNTVMLRSNMETMKIMMLDMESRLSTCSNITSVQSTVHKLEKGVENLQVKCLDLEGRM